MIPTGIKTLRRCRENNCRLRLPPSSTGIRKKIIYKGEDYVNSILQSSSNLKACDCIVIIEVVSSNREILVLVELKDDVVTEKMIRKEIIEKFQNTLRAIVHTNRLGDVWSDLLLLARSYDTGSSPMFWKTVSRGGLKLHENGRTFFLRLKKCGDQLDAEKIRSWKE